MTRTENTATMLEEILVSRENFYKMLAIFYRNTLTLEQIDMVESLEFTKMKFEEPLLEKGFDDIRRYLRKRNTGTRQALATEYTSVFAGLKTHDKQAAIPCASLFLPGAKQFYGNAHHDVYKIYKQELVRVDKDLNLPSDHLTFELEFLGIMSKECMDAVSSSNYEQALHKLTVSEDFIENHILKWFDNFENVASSIIETRFYRGVLKITKGYLLTDLKTIKELSGVVSDEMTK